MNGKLSNFIVTISNIFGLLPIYKSFNNLPRSSLELFLIIIAVIASILMHISETKHNLPGIYLSKYSNYMLYFDRITAYLLVFYMIYKLIHNSLIITGLLILKIITGLLCAIGSEITNNEQEYVFLHCIWHFFAYKIIYELI